MANWSDLYWALGWFDRIGDAIALDLETQSFPPVPYDDPAWDDPTRYTIGPWLPEDAIFVPPELDPDGDCVNDEDDDQYPWGGD